MTTKLLSSLLLSSLLLAACGKSDADKTPAAAKTAEPATKTAEPATKTAEPAMKTETPAPAAALADIDLGKGGAAWQGVQLKGRAGAEVTENGTGGVIVNFADNTLLQIVPEESPDLSGYKAMLASSFKSVTYSVDTPTEVVFKTVTDMGGNMIEGHGFSTVVPVGSMKVSCGSTFDDAATATRMLAVCKSLTKK